MRVIDCKHCGNRNLPERYDPLRITFSTGEQTVIFGLPFFKCEGCDEIYTTQFVESTELFSELYEKLPEGVNTIIL